jgi:hypothetical protein
MGEIRNVCRILAGKTKGRDTGIQGSIILKWYLKI